LEQPFFSLCQLLKYFLWHIKKAVYKKPEVRIAEQKQMDGWFNLAYVQFDRKDCDGFPKNSCIRGGVASKCSS